MASPDRGEVWLVDLGMAAKIRPCLILSVALQPKTFLKAGAFDAQGLVTVAPPRMVRRLGHLAPAEMASVEQAVKLWLGL